MAKHLVESGAQDIPVGTPIFVTVDDASAVDAFKDFTADAAAPPPPEAAETETEKVESPPPSPPPAAAPPAPKAEPVAAPPAAAAKPVPVAAPAVAPGAAQGKGSFGTLRIQAGVVGLLECMLVSVTPVSFSRAERSWQLPRSVFLRQKGLSAASWVSGHAWSVAWSVTFFCSTNVVGWMCGGIIQLSIRRIHARAREEQLPLRNMMASRF